jgi:hypothetical protein
MANIRRIEKGESDILNKIVIQSEACWGYDKEYMENFKDIYRVTEEFISTILSFF